MGGVLGSSDGATGRIGSAVGQSIDFGEGAEAHFNILNSSVTYIYI